MTGQVVNPRFVARCSMIWSTNPCVDIGVIGPIFLLVTAVWSRMGTRVSKRHDVVMAEAK